MRRNTKRQTGWRRGGGIVAAVLLALATIGYGYWVAGTVGGAIPTNGDWRQPDRGVTIFIEDNGIHTGIVLPKALLAGRFDRRVRARDLRDPAYAGHEWLAVGWGDRSFYIETPRWSDLNPLTVVRAGIGSDRTVLHVEHVARPVAGAAVRAVRLRPQEFARLVNFIADDFAAGDPVAGYGAHDAFYSAHGRYSALHTCNDWTGAALRHAGVRMGRWTPFPGTVMRWL